MEEGIKDGSSTKDNLVSSHKGSARISGPSTPESRAIGYENAVHQAAKNIDMGSSTRYHVLFLVNMLEHYVTIISRQPIKRVDKLEARMMQRDAQLHKADWSCRI
ncbi:hypothetical protein E2542_SST26245 [Spatholobus suberectus]|nr:hypothetical protein E2542_SST26245 [Spatholobus suberectus]